MGGHSEDIAKHLQNYELKQKILDEQSKPLSKLGFVEVISKDVDAAYDAIACFYPAIAADRPKWSKINIENDVTDTPTARPVTCMVYAGQEDRKTFYKKVEDDLEKLHTIGCPVLWHLHKYKQENKDNVQGCVAIPCIALEGTNEKPEYVRDVENRAIFCAWLVNRGFATETEIEKNFGLGYSQEAKKQQIVKKIEDAFGPPVQNLAR